MFNDPLQSRRQQVTKSSHSPIVEIDYEHDVCHQCEAITPLDGAEERAMTVDLRQKPLVHTLAEMD